MHTLQYGAEHNCHAPDGWKLHFFGHYYMHMKAARHSKIIFPRHVKTKARLTKPVGTGLETVGTGRTSLETVGTGRTGRSGTHH
jgi:hypothetical protein